MQPKRDRSRWSGIGTTVAVIALTLTLLETGALPGQEAAPAYEVKLALLEGLELEVHRLSGSTGRIDLQDFAAKAQRGLDFMLPGSRMLVQGLETAAPVAGAVEDRLVEILEMSHEDLAQERDPDWALRLVAEWKIRGARAAQVDWVVLSSGEEQVLRSTAVFDSDSRVLYDTVLAGFIEAASEPAQVWDDSSELRGEGGAITSTASASVTGTYQIKVGGLFGGSVDLNVRVGMTSQVAPYIEGSTNDAHVRAATNEIKCWRANGKGIAPDGSPQVYFGSGGRYAAIYGNAVPFKSTLRLTAESDSFQNGTYVVSGNDGRNWELSFSVGVQAGPV
ncbi:MAG TPA: hypothetical protein VMT52_05620, partial [Planctomycetota bacterium]|nr:hypothetical protein [Planctomycetota bacterium]